MLAVPVFRLCRWVEDITPHPSSFPANHWVRFPSGIRPHVHGDTYGGYRIVATARIDGNPVKRRLSLLRRRDLRVILFTWSDPKTGEYTFEHIAKDDYLIICDDYSRTYNAAVADWVEPELME